MSESRIKLHSDSFWISPYGFSCFVALREKEIPFDYVAVSLPDREQLRAELANRGLTGRVPVLEHGDFFLGESSAIIEYLEETFPSPKHPRVLPEGVRERARARQVM